MPLILETTDFVVMAPDHPHHDRNNGGHAKVSPKKVYADRTDMPMDVFVTFMMLSMLLGEAVTTVMRKKGVPIVRINYQDNGNWAYFPSMHKEPHVHIHIYARSSEEKHPAGDTRFKPFPNSLVTPYVGDSPEYYAPYQAYSLEDCADIKAEMLRLLETERYQELRTRL